MKVLLSILILWAVGVSAYSAATELRLRQMQQCQSDVRWLLDSPQNMLPAYMALLRSDCH